MAALRWRNAGSAAGRVIVLTTTLDDSWNDLELKPVYLPLVHQFVRYVSQYEQSTVVGHSRARWSISPRCSSRRPTASWSRRAASGAQIGANDPSILELTEHGAYEIRSASMPVRTARIALP